MKHIIFLFTILFLVFSCKAPKNAINVKSLPPNCTVINITDPVFEKVYSDNGSAFNQIMIWPGSSVIDSSTQVVLMDNHIKCVNITKKITDSLCLVLGFENGKLCNTSSIQNRSQVKNELGLLLNDGTKHNEVVFHDRGKSFLEIADTFHKDSKQYFNKNYRLFLNDTLDFYTDKEYSSYFSEYDGTKGNFDFLSLSIAYYKVFPDKMIGWSSVEKSNMEFLSVHLFDETEQILNLMDNYENSGDSCKFRLCQLILYCKTKSADYYRSSQFSFSAFSEYRWFHLD